MLKKRSYCTFKPLASLLLKRISKCESSGARSELKKGGVSGRLRGGRSSELEGGLKGNVSCEPLT